MSYRVNVFISHSWSYSYHYEKLAEWLYGSQWNVSGVPVVFSDTSVPKNDPIHNAPTKYALKQAIHARIKQSNVVIIPTGMYATHSYWIGEEISSANLLSKPIVGVNPWGQQQKSSVVTKAAGETVGWSKKSVGNAVWRCAPK